MGQWASLKTVWCVSSLWLESICQIFLGHYSKIIRQIQVTPVANSFQSWKTPCFLFSENLGMAGEGEVIALAVTMAIIWWCQALLLSWQISRNIEVKALKVVPWEKRYFSDPGLFFSLQDEILKSQMKAHHRVNLITEKWGHARDCVRRIRNHTEGVRTGEVNISLC